MNGNKTSWLNLGSEMGMSHWEWGEWDWNRHCHSSLLCLIYYTFWCGVDVWAGRYNAFS